MTRIEKTVETFEGYNGHAVILEVPLEEMRGAVRAITALRAIAIAPAGSAIARMLAQQTLTEIDR